MTLNHKHWHLPHWTPAPLIEMNLLAALNSTPPPQSSPSLSLYHGVFKVTKPLDFDTHHIPDIEELWGVHKSTNTRRGSCSNKVTWL